MSNFDPDAILRGVQLTAVGANTALRNPRLFTTDHYRQAALAVSIGIAVSLLVSIPVHLVKALIWCFGFFVDLTQSTWDNDVIDTLKFIENSVLQAPFFFMSLMRYITPTLDNVFMDSLAWVDQTYYHKHKAQDPKDLRQPFYQNLNQYSVHGPTGEKKKPSVAIKAFVYRFGRKAGISLAVYVLSFLPYVGQFVLPAASFYTFQNAVGTKPAVFIFASSLALPKRYIIVFLQTYFSSRSLMRELLEPYFARLRYTPEQKRRWFKDREGVLFGFAMGFFTLLKIPLVGVLIYGIAEASTAYLITKITEPPPAPAQSKEWMDEHVRWKNKHEFMAIPFALLDEPFPHGPKPVESIRVTEPLPGKEFL
ncbi:transmembrane protein UsgS [Trichodelitschia bisporula]|uniref:Transmembrane protein UsgS n=1 Tax=Trichodelitschia bisporula TaxID=703511 RepID=A0A6G1I2A2_9PEZI|nr:transmembrane protein UsgS [Trichodelitschia bisporula]